MDVTLHMKVYYINKNVFIQSLLTFFVTIFNRYYVKQKKNYEKIFFHNLDKHVLKFVTLR